MLPPMFNDQHVILFQGDSITDAGRDRALLEPNLSAALGMGYAQHTAAALLSRFAEKRLQIYNRGVGGNIVQQLEERWEADCLQLRPDLLSVLIGINDTARSHRPGQSGFSVADFDKCLRRLLIQARQQNPQIRLVVCEPFMALVRDEQKAWQEGFEQRRAVTHRIATELKAAFVPFQSLFNDLLNQAPVKYWLPDGVHPTLPAHLRMSQLWLDRVQRFNAS